MKLNYKIFLYTFLCFSTVFNNAYAQVLCQNTVIRIGYPRVSSTGAIPVIPAGPYTPTIEVSPFYGTPSAPCMLVSSAFRLEGPDYSETGNKFELTDAPLGTYTVYASATLASGEVFTASTQFTTVDKTGPKIDPVLPEPGTEIGDTAIFEANVNDAHGVAYVRFYRSSITEKDPLNYVLINEDTSPPYTTAIDTKKLPEGSIRIHVVAMDIARNISRKYFDYTINNDNKPPVAFFYDRTERVVSGEINLHVYINDPEKMESAQFYVDGVRVYTTTDRLFRYLKIDTTLFPDGKRFITVLVTDSRNVAVQQTIVLEFRNYADDKDPYVEITSHQQGQTVKGQTIVTVNALDESGIDRVEFSFGSQPMGVDTTEPYSTELNTFLYANAVYDLVATAIDRAGRSKKVTVFLAVQNNQGQPEESTLAIVSPKDGAYVAGLAEISIAALDNVAYKTVALYINGDEIGRKDLPPYKFIIDTEKYEDGEYSVVARGIDYSGNVKESLIKLKISNKDITKARPNETVNISTNPSYKDNVQAAATMLNAQVAKLEFQSKNASKENKERSKAIKGTIKSLSGILKEHKVAFAADKNLKDIAKLAKQAINKANALLGTKEVKSFSQNKRTIIPILKKLTLAFSKI